MTRKDPMRILEAGYRLGLDEEQWARGIVEAVRPFNLGGGASCATVDIGKHNRHRTVVCEGGVFTEAMVRAIENLPAVLFQMAYAPAPTQHNFDLVHLAIAKGMLSLDELMSKIGMQLAPGWGVIGGDAQSDVVALVLPTDKHDSLNAQDRATLDAVGAHLGAALRLRKALGNCVPTEHSATEAIMSPDGKVHEARGAARGALLELVDAAKRTERARSRLADDDEKLALWTALHDGQWSFVDTTESDGKRMLLACRNEPTTRPLRDLSRRERSVMEYAALGHSNKYIAYELGLSMASVSSILKRVMSKLGLESRSALIRMFGAGVARLP